MDFSEIKNELKLLYKNGNISRYGMNSIISKINELESLKTHIWLDFNPDKKSSHPTEYGSYFVQRINGKIHLEIWNGTGWAYNHKVITHWAKIMPPNNKPKKSFFDFLKIK
jgi:hypothetical protein